MTYRPDPIDTRDIELPGELLQLVELLARNAHEVWALERLNQGWVFGSRRCDVRKHHPDLIPYEELPESEKEYDRKMAQEVLKTITLLGFKISRRPSP